ncbi:GtrA family protein [Seohaeicola saemankumensis]|uniref:GtrA family protein n=1 Tax=Seohaeicola saemankumensis TaxID=481181 RepID=UPI001E596777|nr:GtrA family protein [Seohaeicola saemankumensis]MCD1627282.1 GtrA family protein [Seohaeicola saemankumensis]
MLRYVINGLIATGVHYAVLTINLNFFGFASAGLANFVAAFFGITASFLGSRYYVFRSTQADISKQFFKFSGLYVSIAFLHGTILWLWTDKLGLDFRIGFLIATTFQVSISYFGNKLLVFKT